MIAVIPMAGRGARFSAAGYHTPKPLLPLLGRPLLFWATRSLPLDCIDKLVFVVLREHVEKHDIVEQAREHLNGIPCEFTVVDSVPNGQLMSVLAARAHLDTRQPVVIYNTDTYTQPDYPKMVAYSRRAPEARDVAGLLVVFAASGEHWSFARETEDGSVDLVVEKRRISDLCSNGMYWFRSGKEFLHSAETHIEAFSGSGEHYVAPIYNQLIAAGKRIEVERVERVLSFGTPAEYVESEVTLESWLS